MEGQVNQRYDNATMLDVGFVGEHEEPTIHLNLRRLNPYTQIVGMDINQEGVMKWHLPDTLVADGYRLPFKDGSFGAVLCLEVLEHLYDPLSLIREFWRVLRADGDLIITTPNAWAWWNFLRFWLGKPLRSPIQRDVYRSYLGASDHKQFYEPLSLMNILDDSGFTTLTLTTKNHAIPMLRRWMKSLEIVDLGFYPMNRLGGYICLVARKRESVPQFNDLKNTC